ncbi:MAG: hypothetical protein HZB36_00970 [Candidatus Omnitrophica bacterium]|nr:hypothetical protein [Candidatus Omnitrophota bacterium]
MAKWVDEGETRVAQILFGAQAVDATLYLGLYTNTTEPAETANLAAITEPSGNGYARIALSRGTWTITADHADYAQQTFTASGGNWGNVYGYFIATSSDGTGKLLCVEQFSTAPFNVNDGDSVKVTPKITVA